MKYTIPLQPDGLLPRIGEALFLFSVPGPRGEALMVSRHPGTDPATGAPRLSGRCRQFGNRDALAQGMVRILDVDGKSALVDDIPPAAMAEAMEYVSARPHRYAGAVS